MSDSSDLIKLYSARILALTADIPHLGHLDPPAVRVRKRSPLCGSTVTVTLEMAEGRVVRFAQDVKACALGQAAAAIVGQSVIGCTGEQLDRAARQLATMLRQAGPVPDAPFAGFEALIPARDFKNRHASILLAIEATAEAAALAQS